MLTPRKIPSRPMRSKPAHQPNTERERHPQALKPLAVKPNYAICVGAAVGVPKGERAKPGKRAPNAEERRWMAAIVEFGCVACWLDRMPPRPTAVHHLLRGGVRMGHLHSIGLCDPGHHQNGQQFGMVSRHPDKAAFEAKYGTETELLAILLAEIGEKA